MFKVFSANWQNRSTGGFWSVDTTVLLAAVPALEEAKNAAQASHRSSQEWDFDCSVVVNAVGVVVWASASQAVGGVAL